MYDLKNKVAIVTGAGGRRGFGRAIANRLAKDGANIVIVDKLTVLQQDKTEGWQGIKSVVAEIETFGRQGLGLVCDITKSQEVDKAVADTILNFGKIDILVNNAGIHINRSLQEMDDATWNNQIAVNLTGTFFFARSVAREMMKRGEGGRIINIGSLRSKTAAPGEEAYCASKFGVIGLTQSLALELAPHKILVNAVCPALTDTDINLEMFQNQSKRDLSVNKKPGRL
jgi:meso-butanediol dehydrogenase / (S,S)-butanediol dehydrogenase / diacetyl reductase